MSEILDPSELTLDEHIQRIKECLERVRKSLFDTVLSIKECKEQLGDEVFQKDVSEMLGMSPSTLNRWISIGNSVFIMSNQDQLPHTFSSLYNITQLEKKYLTHYPKDGMNRLEKMLKNGEISITSQQADITDILKIVDDRIKRKQKKDREKNIIQLSGKTLQPSSKSATLSELVKGGNVFKTIVVNLPKELMSRWGSSGVFEMDIMEEFPIHKLRSPSTSETVSCLVKVPMSKIDVGLKVLSSFGFTYRDAFIPSQPIQYPTIMKKEEVILRGERGFENKLKNESIKSTEASGHHQIKINDLVQYCEENLPSPYLMVFDTFGSKTKGDWVSVNEV